MTEFLADIAGVGGFGGAETLGAMFFTFTCVFFLVLAFLDMGSRRSDIRRRALIDRGFTREGNAIDEAWLNRTNSLRYQSLSATSALLGDVERQAKEKETEASKIKRDLLKAGYFGANAVLWYQSLRFTLCVSFGIVAYILVGRSFPAITGAGALLAVAVSAALGFLLPSRYVAFRRVQIVRQCSDGFPDFIDLLVICAEGGLSPRAAIDRISREVAQTYPYLGANLYIANLEIRAGNSLHDALFNLGRRTEVEEATALANLLQQTEALGTSISDALRIYSDEMRERRLMRAEEKAHALPVKLMLPLGFFIFPVVLVVILLPVVLRVKKALM
ncbi:MAG: type II secretion system F family protein [Rhodomicrobium sp.]|jgi:tight adherence protein C